MLIYLYLYNEIISGFEIFILNISYWASDQDCAGY